ncbi:XisH protein [Scytonema sp. HK-05]|uniref:element excision factor XisH family protein n=1 Tax=unclassified Scytonema TaxID=2618749 RepID=UPI000935830C|nr:element excision factor XisH family protein [Scytonema sp. HK-05]OKH59107.1 fatty-acid synthase [Scytonema sp. HK-05]BAY48700.1 XisH protein [Scytonema sp. HK-05]
MPARDIYHDAVKNALLKDGWTITDDPLHLKWGQKDMYVDLGAQRLLAAEQGNKKIAVEIKSFVSPSEMQDLKDAIGGFVMYRAVIGRLEPERTLYLAVRDNVFTALFEEPIGKLLIESENLYLVVFNPDSETIVQWIP